MGYSTWVIGNWKMNPETVSEARALISELTCLSEQSPLSCQLAIAPGLIHMHWVDQSSLKLCAQNLSAQGPLSGAHTGEVSAAQLKDAGVELVLVGHSERRADQKEGASVLTQKLEHALDQGLRPVLCCGESLEVRERSKHLSHVAEDLTAILKPLKTRSDIGRLIMAYEPIWAIGTGRSAEAADAQAMHAHIRQTVSELNGAMATCPILYGGSVKPHNAAEYAAYPDINGALVGGASLSAPSFMDIAQAFS